MEEKLRFRSLCCLVVAAVLAISCGHGKSAAINSGSTQPALQVSTTESKKAEGFFSAIDPRAVGAYLPRKYIEALKASRNHSLSIHSPDANYRSLLIVQPEIIYSNLMWHDQYAITDEDGKRFKFVISGDRADITDENSFVYDRISSDTGDGYGDISRFIVGIIFDGLPSSSGVEVLGDRIKVNSVEFSVNLDDMFSPKNDNLLLWNSDRKIDLGLIITDGIYQFIEIDSISDEPGSVNTDRVFFQTGS